MNIKIFVVVFAYATVVEGCSDAGASVAFMSTNSNFPVLSPSFSGIQNQVNSLNPKAQQQQLQTTNPIVNYFPLNASFCNRYFSKKAHDIMHQAYEEAPVNKLDVPPLLQVNIEDDKFIPLRDIMQDHHLDVDKDSRPLQYNYSSTYLTKDGNGDFKMSSTKSIPLDSGKKTTEEAVQFAQNFLEESQIEIFESELDKRLKDINNCPFKDANDMKKYIHDLFIQKNAIDEKIYKVEQRSQNRRGSIEKQELEKIFNELQQDKQEIDKKILAIIQLLEKIGINIDDFILATKGSYALISRDCDGHYALEINIKTKSGLEKTPAYGKFLNYFCIFWDKIVKMFSQIQDDS